jgi:phospholipid/cholesterol/gamma-HCH transport system ATP-binding protein
MTSVRAIADKTALLYQGRIIWQGTTQELEQSDDPFLNQFINGLAHGPIEVEGQALETVAGGAA